MAPFLGDLSQSEKKIDGTQATFNLRSYCPNIFTVKSGQCVQPSGVSIYPVVGNEDCLHLNVYFPEIEEPDVAEKGLLPVMVWFHGGKEICRLAKHYRCSLGLIALLITVKSRVLTRLV